MTVEVLQRGTKEVRCECGALLQYGLEDVHRTPPPVGTSVTHTAVIYGGWPWIRCPSCHRAVLVSGCF